MKKILLFLLLACSSALAQNQYFSYFSLTENPISENSSWQVPGSTATQWGNMRSDGAHIYGVSEPTQFGDPTAILQGTWGANQAALGVVYVSSVPGSCCHEVELRLRTKITSSNIQGYEILCPVHASPGYGIQIVRWNGGNGQFVYLNTGSAHQCVNGDVIRASISGTNPATITVNISGPGGTVSLSACDNGGSGSGGTCGGNAYSFSGTGNLGAAAGPWTDGTPGLGVYGDQGSDPLFINYGLSAFGATNGAIVAASSCSGANVASAIATAATGDAVFAPPGSCSWSGSTVSINGITLFGAGKDATRGTVITSGSAAITKNASAVSRLSGFRFTGTDVHATVTGSTSSRAYAISDSYFFSSTNDFFDLNANGGIVWGSTFFMNPSSSGGPDVMMIHPNEDWSQATTFGTADTQGPNGGERNIYFEDNAFTNCLETCPDGDQGARLVIRHNTYVDSSIVFHSGGPVNDTSTDGTRQFEIYSNIFQRVTSSNNVNKWVWVRGGSGVIANNAMDVVSTQDFGNKVGLSFGIGCEGSPSYPILHQIGQTTAPATENPPSHPLIIFGNTGAGSTNQSGYTFLAISGNDSGGGGHTCTTPSTYVQQNRDYYLSNQWGWTAFTYPHPLRLAAPSGGGGGQTINRVVGGSHKIGGGRVVH